MSGRLITMTLFATAALIMAGCQQQSKQPAPAPQTTSEAPAPAAVPETAAPAAAAVAKAKEAATAQVAKTATEVATKAKEVATEQVAKPVAAAAAKLQTASPAPAAVPVPAATPKPQAVAPAPAPAQTAKTVAAAATAAMAAKAAAPAPKSAAAPTEAFSTTRCQACHAIDRTKIGPAWKDVVAAYGTEDALAKVFESGFAVKDRKIASSEAKFKSKAGLMTSQYDSLIKGHDKAAAHALFMTVKNGKFGTY